MISQTLGLIETIEIWEFTNSKFLLNYLKRCSNNNNRINLGVYRRHRRNKSEYLNRFEQPTETIKIQRNQKRNLNWN